MNKIPLKLRNELSEDLYYKKCCIADGECSGKIEWHHNLIYAGKQVQRKFCILPVCKGHHAIADRKDIKNNLDRVMILRSTEEDLQEFPKKNWHQMKTWLNI